MARLGHPTAGTGRSAPSGFTLVELLVVISIIGMLTAIAVPTIFGAIASARNAKTKSEIDLLQMALMNYKNEYGSFPPANMGPTDTTTPAKALSTALWVSGSVNTKHPAYKHLVRIFPRLSERVDTVDSPFYTMSRMSPAQALVFWLQGFYENPEFPITNNGTPGSRKRLFDFDDSRLYAASMPYSFKKASPQTFSARSSATPSAEEKACPVYFTGHPSAGLPYVYFDSRGFDSAYVPDIFYAARNVSGEDSVAYPYINALPPANPTWGQLHSAGETFQIIAAGKDGSYGTVQAAFPKATGSSYTFLYDVNGTKTSFSFFYVDDKVNAAGHADNLVNFADRALADALEAVKSQ